MARNILAEMVISLRDNLSGPAKKAADSLDKVKNAADRLGAAGGNNGAVDKLTSGLQGAAKAAADLARSGTRLRDWGTSFDKQLLRLKATPSEIEKIRAGFNQLNASIAQMDAKTRTNTLKNYLTGARAELLGIRAAANDAAGAVGRLGQNAKNAGLRGSLRSLRGALGTVGAVAGIGGAAYTAGRVVKASAEEGSAQAREKLRQQNSGMSASDSARLAAASTSLAVKYPSMLPREIAEMGRDIRTLSGSTNEALHLLPDFVQTSVALKTAQGKSDPGALKDFMQFIEVIGRTQQPEAVKALLDSYVRTQQAGGMVKPSDYLSAAQTGGAAAKSMSVDAWAKIMPALMLHGRGYRTGTDIMSAYQNLAIGRGTKGSLKEQTEFVDATNKAGLREGVTFKKSGSVDKPGTLIDQNLYTANPYEWVKKHLVPKLAQEGLLPQGYASGDFSTQLTDEQRGAVSTRVSSMMSNRRGASIVDLFLSDMAGLEKQMKMLDGMAGKSTADSDQFKDAFVALEGLTSSLKNLGGELTQPWVSGAAANMTSWAQGIGELSKSLSNQEDLAKGLSGLTAIATAAGALAAFFSGPVGAAVAAMAGITIGGKQIRDNNVKRFEGVEPGQTHELGRKDIRTERQKVEDANRVQREGFQRFANREPAATGKVPDVIASKPPSPPAGKVPDVLAPTVDSSALQQAKALAAQAGNDIKSALDVEGKPKVDTSGMEAAVPAAKSIMERLQAIFNNVLRPKVVMPTVPGGGGSTPSAPGRASGGHVGAGRFYTVGENGQELFQPGTSGRVIPGSSKSRQASSGGERSGGHTFHLGGIHIHGVANAEDMIDKVTSAIEQKLSNLARSMYADYGLEEPG